MSCQIDPDASAPSVCTHERLNKVSDLKAYRISPDFKFRSGPKRSAIGLLRDESFPVEAAFMADVTADGKGVETPSPIGRSDLADSSGVVLLISAP